MNEIITIANQKGGVGKNVCQHLANAFANGYKTLFIVHFNLNGFQA